VRLLEQLVQTEASRVLGWTIVHSLWEGIVVVALLAMTLPLLRDSRTRYRATLIAMGALTFCVLATVLALTPAVSPGLTGSTSILRLPPLPDAAASLTLPNGYQLHQALPWLTPIWAAGVMLFYLRLAASCIAASRIRRRGVCVAPAEWQQRMTLLGRRLRISKPVVLLESALAQSPVVIGHLRPAVLMPVGLLTGMTPEQIEMILAHELAHVKRNDYLINVLQTIVEGLMFYHPCVWWMSSVMRKERENCCDDAVIELNGDPHGYAFTLAALERSRWEASQLAMAATGGGITQRVRRLIKPEVAPSSGLGSMIALAVLAASGVLATAQIQGRPPLVALSPAQAGASETASPYEKWLTGDVAYLVKDPERFAFRQLKTDEERNKFIEQFWQRRDPTPGTPQNEFKEEHYRRIAYANERYASTVEGWKTDRGRIYIVFGPPDEVESHPSGGRYRRPANEGGGDVETVPFEKWQYKYIEGVGTQVVMEFVDPNRNGEYRQTRDPREKEDRRGATPGNQDLSCTYYENGKGSPGTCGFDQQDRSKYRCYANDDATRSNPQIACEWKVRRAMGAR